MTPSKLLLRANLTASLIDVHRLSSSWNSGSLSLVVTETTDNLANNGDPAPLDVVGDVTDDTLTDAVKLGNGTAADPCLGEGRDSGSIGSLRFRPTSVDPSVDRENGVRPLLYPQYVLKNTASIVVVF
jgi:hypothetical protein